VNKYHLLDALSRYSRENCEGVDAKYIEVIIITLSATANMASNPQFIDLFNKICNELDIDYKKWLN
tara:strand:+ start:200 stop:397 length:198 start_codon:yes stop_codon:yes gene_type:complete